MLVLAVVALIAVVLIAWLDIETTAVGCTVLGAFTISWNGVLVGGERPGDILIILAVLLFLITGVNRPLPTLPTWVTVAGAAVAVVGILHWLFPTDAAYLDTRTILAANGQRTIETQGNLFVAIKFFVAVVGLPAAVAFTGIRRKPALRWVASAFAAGVAVSAWIAFSDSRGITAIGKAVTGNNFGSNREGGLSNHPNFLAAACVIALPLAMMLILERRRALRWLGVVSSVGILLGTFATGSRGGAACVLLAAGLSLVLDPRFSRQLVKIVLVAVLIVVTAVLTSPSLGHSLLKATRLTSSSSASGSNIVRHAVQQQGIDDFEHSPADGVGLQVAAEATNVYIQELAAGGLLLFIGMQVFTIGGLAAAWRMRRDEVMAYPLLASLITAAVFDYIEADLTDRFYYVPAALVAGLSAVRVAQQRALAAEPAAEIHVPQRVGAVVR